jgi:hypothetical protein
VVSQPPTPVDTAAAGDRAMLLFRRGLIQQKMDVRHAWTAFIDKSPPCFIKMWVSFMSSFACRRRETSLVPIFWLMRCASTGKRKSSFV